MDLCHHFEGDCQEKEKKSKGEFFWGRYQNVRRLCEALAEYKNVFARFILTRRRSMDKKLCVGDKSPSDTITTLE